jgi:toxin ParE1/3/4
VAASQVKTRWTELAVDNLRLTHEYLADKSPASADTIVDRIFSAIEMLQHHPFMGRTGRVSDTRELVITGTRFIVCYRLRDEQVEVLAVQHGAKRWPKAF